MPDSIDIRDWVYQPGLLPVPPVLVNCGRVPEILDQGQEGACTGFALAAVANFLLHNQGQERRVSPRMFYEMARRYDEWPGEWYEGSSARGAMKGWLRHGVAQRSVWGDTQTGTAHMTPAVVRDAMRCPGGAYYRVNHRQVRDMHAALAEVGILYVTLMVHDGWFEPGPGTTTIAGTTGAGTAAATSRRRGRGAASPTSAVRSRGRAWARGTSRVPACRCAHCCQGQHIVRGSAAFRTRVRGRI